MEVGDSYLGHVFVSHGLTVDSIVGLSRSASDLENYPVPMRKILIANRGEIAIRIMRAATEFGIRTAPYMQTKTRLEGHSRPSLMAHPI